MARKQNEEQRNLKREMIIEKAHGVFCDKGFLKVTMKDIVEACEISRGGLYLFYSSVKEVFQAVISNRNKRRFEEVRQLVEKNEDFILLFEMYFNKQKERLLHMENSFLMAVYEYYSVHQSQEEIQFRDSQIACIKNTILDILNLGVKQGVIINNNLDDIAQCYMFLIEGMSVFGMLHNISEKYIDIQINLMIDMLKFKKEGEVS